MGSVLFGGQKSGTPTETRGGTQALASFYQSMLKQGGPQALASTFGRGASESAMNMLGFDPSKLGLEDVVHAILADPTDSTSGLFRSMQPFESEETARQVAGVRNQFGTMGGRFSRNVGTAEAQTRGQVAGNFAVNRENALLTAGGQRAQALMGLLGNMTQMRQQAFNEQMMPLQLMQSFLTPGAPQFQEGILPGILGLGGTLMLGRMMQNPSQSSGASGGTLARIPTNLMLPQMPPITVR